MKRQIKIGDRIIGDGLFIIAEVGNQFNADMGTTFNLIDVVADSGADAIKFIFWFPDEIMCDNPMYTYQGRDGEVTEPMRDLLERLTFSLSEWRMVKNYCDKCKVMMLSTIQSKTGIEWAEELKLPAYKLSAWDWNNPLLYRAVAEKGKPIIWDIGTINEMTMWDTIKKLDSDILIMHEFHTEDYNQMNMKSILYLTNECMLNVGFSSTDQHDELDSMAVGLGAVALEKRLTISRKNGVLHSAISKEPREFREYVTKMRNLYNALGEYKVEPSDNDMDERLKWFRHLVAERPIKKGEIITRDMLEAKRGWDGKTLIRIEDFVGKPATRDYVRNESLE